MGNKIQKTIEINAKVKASLEGMEKTVNDLEKGLEKQKFDLNKNSGLSKLIKDYKEAKAELDELMSGDVIARTDIKKAEQLGGKVSKLYKQIGKSFEDLRAGSDDTFRKLFPDSFTTKISKGTKAIENFFSKLDSKSVKEGRLDEARKDLVRLNDELDGLKNRRLKIEVEVDKKGVKDELDRINKDLEQMRENFKKKLIPEEKRDSQGRTQTEKLNSSVSTWSNKLARDTEAKRSLKVQSLSKSQSSQISKLEGQLVDAQGASLADIEKKRLDALHAEQTKRATIAKTPGARDTSRSRREYGGVTDKELAAQIAASEKELQRLQNIVDKINDIKQQPQRAYEAAVKKLETQIKTDRTNLEKAEKALEAHTTQREAQEAVASQKADDFMAGKQVAEATQAEIDALKALNEEKEKSLDLEKKLKEEKTFDSQDTKDSAIAKKDSSIEKKRLEIQELENTIKNLANDTDFDAIFKKLQELGIHTDGIDKTRAGLEGIKTDLESLDENTLKEIREALKQMGVDAKDTDTKVDTLTQGMEQLGDTDKDLKRAENEMENLKNQVLQFFSLTNAVQLFKRAVTSALNTVKELDATMTEAAVVTDFSIGDMWDKLPQYSAEAQKLGVSINGMYQATTLYYQQGLKNNEAMALGVETMKMGKIAAMDSTEATKAMTAALRGFNMELNETSATRVNDVYSQLAAVTAADTNQIATAMEKTASIAASANMEFETTAALLAQIIETTQEAPETAGTALKTIIARFSEVKSLKEQGQTTGKDSEGEDIDVNKIQTALRSVGISMDGFFAGTEGLDSVLLKLAEKWGSLDFETQRYIATMAAGSRQQSRFIAMMSDYGRTTELVGEAQNSAGASQRQFEKTQESLATSLQKLKNAWDEFLMGLANNEVLKFAVDSLTFIVEGINKIIDAISGGNGLIKALTSLFGVIGALKLGKSVLSGTGFGKILGGFTGQTGAYKETVTETQDENGSPMKIITREPYKEGEQAGQKAGQGFGAGFKRALDAYKSGKPEGIITDFFTTGAAKEVDGKNIGGEVRRKYIQKKYEQKANKDLQQTAKKGGKTDYLAQIYERNAEGIKGADGSVRDLDIGKISNAYDKVIEKGGTAKQAAAAANAEVSRMGGTILDVGQTEQMTAEQTSNLSLNMGALGGAAMGVGAALGGLSALFSALGMDEAAEATSTLATVFMGLGTVMTTLSSIAPMLGISFTTAGVQITTAGVTSQLAWWWVFLIIGAIALLVVGAIALGKAWEEASDKAKLEKLNERIEDLSSAAEEAKNKLEEITSAREELNELSGVFENLTKGTTEWRKALIENNQKVLELLETYPQLMDHVEKGIHGQLTITSEGWEEILDQQQKGYTSALTAKTALTSQRDTLNFRMSTQEQMAKAWAKTDEADTYGGIAGTLIGTYLGGITSGGGLMVPGAIAGGVSGASNDEFQATLANIGMQAAQMFDNAPSWVTGIAGNFDTTEAVEKKLTGGLTYEEFQDFASKAAEEGYYMADGSLNKDAVENLLDEMGLDANVDDFMDSLDNLGTEFDELANSALMVQEAEAIRVKSIAETVGQTSDIVSGSSYGQAAIDLSSQLYEDSYDSKIEKAKEKYDLGNEDKELDLNNAEVKNALQRYADLNNMTLDEVVKKVNDGEISRDTIATTLASEDVNAKMLKKQEDITRVLEKLAVGKNQSQTEGITGLMSKKGADLGIDFLNQLKGYGKKEFIDFLGEYGFTDQDAKDMGFFNLQFFGLSLYKNLEDAQEGLKQTYEKANDMGLQEQAESSINDLNEQLRLQGLVSGLTVSQSQDLINAMTEITLRGGKAAEVMNNIPNMLAGLSGDQLKQGLSLITSTDWQNVDSIESTITALRGLGADIDNDLAKALKEASAAIKTFNLQRLETELQNISELSDKLAEKLSNGSKTFTKEEAQAYMAQGFDDFVRIGYDEYVYLGDMTELLRGIDGHLVELLNEERDGLDDAIAKGENIGQALDNTYGQEGAQLTGAQLLTGLANGTVVSEQESKNAHKTEDYSFGEWKKSNSESVFAYVFGQPSQDEQPKTVVSRDQLEGLAKDLGIKFDDAWTDQVLIEAIQDAYDTYYLNLNSNKAARAQLGQDVETIEYASQAGTVEFANQYKENREDRTGWDELSDEEKIRRQEEFTSRKTRGKFYQRVLDQVDAGTLKETDLQDAQIAAMYFGMDREVAMNAELQTLQEFLSGGGTPLMDQSLDAVIAAEEGLDVALANTTAQIKAQNEILGADESALKNLVIAANRANKAMDTLNGTLDDQIEAFKLNNRNIPAYNTALSKITAQAKQVFGADVTSEFVEANREAFIALAEGGEAAEQAYGQISEAYGKMKLATTKDLGDQFLTETQMNEIADLMNNTFASVEPGKSIDLTSLQQRLMDMYNLSEEAAQNIVKSWGFSISPETRTVWLSEEKGVPPLIQENDPGPGWKKAKMLMATRNSATGTGFGGGGGGGGSKYENPYDKYHNTLEEINDLLRERERLERRYQRLLDRGTASAYEMREIAQVTVANLEQEIARHRVVQQGRREQIAELVSKNESKLGKYVQAEKLENGEYSIRIDWDLIEGVKNSKTGESIDEFYDELKEYMESDYEMQNEILDKEDAIFDKLSEGKDEYLDLENQVKDAIIQSKQEQIDELSNINDSINDANSNILDSMQKQIDDARQARENEKTEEELSDKQRRLAYLQQDTSGANALEILNLQKEIEEGQESYTDQLIDQKISELQEQNDLAAEQRQRQIDILQAQLDEYSESSRIWQDVANLIVGGTDAKGGLIAGSDLDQLLKSAEAFEGMSKIQQMDWMKETNNLIASALTWLSEGSVSTFKTGQQVQFTDADGNIQTGIADVNGNVKTENGVYENVSWNAREGKYTTDESTEERIAKKKAEEEAANSMEAKIKEKFPYGRPSEIQRNLSQGATGDDVKALQKALNDLGFSTGGENGTFGSKTWGALGKFKDKYGGHGEYGLQANTKAAFRKIEEDGIHYKTGGLADFTGPAWLDGTKSRPEYILNADQTKAFFNLVDVLGSLQTNSGKTVENSGDKSYDIDINVESIGSDYDVEQLADVVKRLINEDARYRNNNAINLMR